MKTRADNDHLTMGIGPWRSWVRAVMVATLVSLLAACAVGQRQVWQKFTYDAINDGWDSTVDLLAYAYGDSDRMLKESIDAPRAPPYKDGRGLPPRTGINGPMPVGEFLYVRWRVKATGQVYEERVDLRERLPADMKDHGLTFVIDGAQLYVYVITPKPKPYDKAPPLNRSWHSYSRYTYEIFPTLTQP